MLNYRQFDAGPDPFGRAFHVYFKWLQTAISIRHSDTVDVKFILEEEGGPRAEKTIAIRHADLIRLERETGRKFDDPFCARLAALHLLHLVTTGEDVEKDLVTVPYPDLVRYGAEIGRAEQSEVGARS
jgi:hypothetical protein